MKRLSWSQRLRYWKTNKRMDKTENGLRSRYVIEKEDVLAV